MPKMIDLTGLRYGRWLVISKSQDRKEHWLCKCDCGRKKQVFGANLRHGKTNSCGCLNVDYPPRIRHGATSGGKDSPEYKSWSNAKSRCNNPLDIGYENYGARGIRMCDEWSRDFEAFLLDMGPRPPSMSLDRIDNNGNYEPINCRWATRRSQNNNRRNNRFLEAEGVSMTLAEASRKSGLAPALVSNRLRRGWPIDRALGLTNQSA